MWGYIGWKASKHKNFKYPSLEQNNYGSNGAYKSWQSMESINFRLQSWEEAKVGYQLTKEKCGSWFELIKMVPKCWKSKLCSTKQQIVVGKWIDLSTKDEDFTSCLMVKSNVGWLSQFYDTVGSNFHKVIYKKVRFSPKRIQFLKNFGQGYQHF